MICHSCGAAGAYSITQRKCVRCGADYRNRRRPESPCPNCNRREPLFGDECSGCGFTGRCRNCEEPTDFSHDPLHCSEECRRIAMIERYEAVD